MRRFEEVEAEAFKKAIEMLPWPVSPYLPERRRPLDGA